MPWQSSLRSRGFLGNHTARFNTLLLPSLGGIGVILAMVGICGVIGYFGHPEDARAGRANGAWCDSLEISSGWWSGKRPGRSAPVLQRTVTRDSATLPALSRAEITCCPGRSGQSIAASELLTPTLVPLTLHSTFVGDGATTRSESV
jgi:hypothetical protein